MNDAKPYSNFKGGLKTKTVLSIPFLTEKESDSASHNINRSNLALCLYNQQCEPGYPYT